jgi:hypothetical protein
MQAGMGLALGGQQRTVLPDDLLKDGNAERMPKLLPLFHSEQQIFRLEQIVRTRQDNQGVCERRNLVREQGFHLPPRTGDRRGPICRRIRVPSVFERSDTGVRAGSLGEPGHQYRRGRSGRNRVNKRGFPADQT